MQISPPTSNSTALARGFTKILHRASRGHALLALLASLICVSMTVRAQDQDRPEITPLERKTPAKKDLGPRAVAVLQMGAKGKSSLVPIAILINGKFWDATAYKADPVPMALDSGTIYEAEQSGSSLGLFTIGSALHSNAQNSLAPWIGTGVWRENGTEPASKELKANAVPVGMDETDGPPRLTRDPTKVKEAPATPKKASTPASTTSSSPSSPDGDEPPTLKRPVESPNPPASGTQKSTTPPADKTGAPDQKSSPAKSDDKQAAKESIPADDSGAGVGQRPVLRRGKPAESFADEDVPGYSKPGSTPSADSAKLVAAAATSDKADVKLIPAISDAGGPPPHSFAFQWLKGEEDDRRKQMMDLAKTELRTYVMARSKAITTVGKTPRRAATRRERKLPEPIFDNVQMIAYDLWNSNQAIIVLSATAHMPPPTAGAPHSDVQSDLQYSITLVAYPDIYNNLHKLYSGVTDKFHLDLTPRLQLVDAVDADGDGYGELLFRETSDAGTGWVIYRASADKLWKMYDSLHPE